MPHTTIVSLVQAPGLPLLFLQHFTGALDNWDPAVTDPLALGRSVILFESEPYVRIPRAQGCAVV
jgi:hypothetical protein